MVTPQELCEIEEIKNLRYLYAHYYDGNRTDELVDLFTEDAVCDFGESYGKWVGKERSTGSTPPRQRADAPTTASSTT
ncbi:MAG: nuclear transport factor 2 family protein [Chloroflexota bacterium]|nr:nuclear transport factor 2 family protein [Chloroflexota bacterium]